MNTNGTMLSRGLKGAFNWAPSRREPLAFRTTDRTFSSPVCNFFSFKPKATRSLESFSFFQVKRPEGSNDESNDCNRVKTAQFSTTAIAERLIKSEPQPRLFLLTTALNKNVV